MSANLLKQSEEIPVQNGVSARYVLKDLRDVMSKEMPLQDRLDRITNLIAQRLNVDVCSCYILRPGDMLELFATKGLDPKSVHETFLRVGEGLIGEIALQRKPLSFEKAWEHASFVYKPETKEKAFKSLMGVPIVHRGTLLGVLAVQKTIEYQFSTEMVELLETIAMVMAEMLASSTIKTLEKKFVTAHKHSRIEGVRLIEGLSVGKAVIHKRMDSVGTILARDKRREIKKLETALKSVEGEINTMLTNPNLTDEQSAIFETYLMFTQDKGWISKITKAIEGGLTAEAAVQKVEDEITARMKMMTDPYIKERIHDFKDLANRLICHLNGCSTHKKAGQIPKNSIVVAKSMGPAELLDYDISRVKGLVLEEGSQTMHVIIVARSLNIPVISGIENACQIVNPSDVLIVDATKGELYINPSDDILDDFETRLKQHKRLQTKYNQQKSLPAETKDGVRISLNINAGLSADLLNTKDLLFDGVGLYRTELPFMGSEQFPDVQRQTLIYRRALIEAKGRPVVFRTLDIGSDKVLPYFENKGEQNPAMGWRSIRITLDRRAILRAQLRAFIRATAGRELRLMFPMIADLQEFLDAKKTLDIELEREKEKGGILPTKILVGTMLEVPSLLFQLPELLKYVDFVSIGTNDLAQFLFATDRGNPIIWNRYDCLSPVFLKTLKYIHDRCMEVGVPCSVCGEMASRSLEVMALVGLGFTRLSMNPASLGSIKAVVRSMDQKQVHSFIMEQLSTSTRSIRPLLRSYALDHDIFI